ncbi:MAG: Hsp20/alpha crystallin family protein [Proteobacteria bacterium]|nr:Hsp20/alpha crystallin family protein [Pseudomonadota bacterium]MDE3207456.1 Hsp20/alpha crystallin family protein [Pseudomonadota bacterium]
MKLDNLKVNIESWLNGMAEGWRHLWKTTSDALTHFKPDEATNLPVASQIDDDAWSAEKGWSVLGAELFEDDQRLVVRVETPGMDKKDLNIEIDGEILIIRGEKRFENEKTIGRWRTFQCAYGSFRRVFPLSVPVKIEAAKASYKNGVLRIEMPKLNPGKVRSVSVKVE